MGGPLARGHVVGMARLNAEPESAIVKEHTGLRARQAGAKVEIQRIDEGADVSFCIDYRKEDRIALDVIAFLRPI